MTSKRAMVAFVAMLIAVKVNILAGILSLIAHNPTGAAFSFVAAACFALGAIAQKVGTRARRGSGLM